MTATVPSPPSETASSDLTAIARRTRDAAQRLAILPTADRRAAIAAVADALEAAAPEILAANAADCDRAKADGIATPLYNRLKLDDTKLAATIAGVRDVGHLPDPIGAVQIDRELDDGLILQRVTCPLGVLGVIFEARPDAAIQISSLAIASGNGAILKGGREAVASCRAIVAAVRRGLESAGVDPDVVQLVTTREEIRSLLSLDRYVDLIIPRGSNSFVRYVQDNTRIPVLGHADGICHVYVDREADLAKAVEIVVDSKVQYPAACNAVETLLVHEDIAAEFLPRAIAALRDRGVTLRGDDATRQFDRSGEIQAATEDDWSTEYSDLVLSVKVVADFEAALEHIQVYASRHTDAIVTENQATADAFLSRVDSAGVFHNCSTRFSDGFRYGFGAEVGISTQTLPPRGPVGLDGLVTYKYKLVGDGHVAATYAGRDAKPFTHRDRA